MNQKLQPHEEQAKEQGNKAFRFGWSFGRKHAGENAETVAEVLPVPSDVEEARITELQQAVRKRVRNVRNSTIAFWILLLNPLLVASLFALNSLETSRLSSHPEAGSQIASYDAHLGLSIKLMEAGLGLSLVVTLVGMVSMFRGRRRLKQAVTAVADTEDLHVVGPLSEALHCAHLTVQIQAAMALNRLLPRLQAGDWDLLNQKQRTCLYRALRASANPRSLRFYNPEFAVTIIRALGPIGDAKAIPIIERLAKSAKDARVRSAAAECLPVLKTRLKAPHVGAAFLDSDFDSKAEPAAGLENTPAPSQSERIETLIRQLQAAHTRKQDYPIGIAGVVVGIVLILGSLAIDFVGQGTRSDGFGFLPGEMVIVASVLFLQYRASRTRGATSALCATDALRVVGPLADALEMGDAWTQAMAMQALTRLLPRLQASDAALLNEAQRACLCRKLDTIITHKIDRQAADFAVSALKALEQVGDGKSLPTVEALSKIKVRTSADGRVRDTATSCLPFLQERAAQQRAAATLLRAASASETLPEVLLRPAAGTTTADTNTLLRPGR